MMLVLAWLNCASASQWVLRSRGSGATLGTVREHVEGDRRAVTVSTAEDGLIAEFSLARTEPDAASGSTADSLWPAARASAALMRRPAWRRFVDAKRVVELGAGLGLTGLAAASGTPRAVTLTDYDDAAVAALEAQCARLPAGCELSAARCDWRDLARFSPLACTADAPRATTQADVVLGSDVAFYFPIVRELMDAVEAHLAPRDSRESRAALIVGGANRASLWTMYHNMRDGCYNQRTDEREPPWPGATRMLLYDLEETNCGDDAPLSLGVALPIAVIAYASSQTALDELIGPDDHQATDADEAAQNLSF